MAINTQFTTAVHIVCLLSVENKPLTSKYIASSVNTNPVVVRRLEAKLKKQGIISVEQGSNGANLLLSPDEITLLDIYKAVNEDDLFKLHENPNPECIIGRNIHEVITDTLEEAQLALEMKLDKVYITDILTSIHTIDDTKKV